jgi:hypothetical protein
LLSIAAVTLSVVLLAVLCIHVTRIATATATALVIGGVILHVCHLAGIT